MYLVAIGLLIGPGMAAGVVLPSVLVTRWFTVHRGRALGIVCAPVVAAVVPLLSVWALQTYGLTFAYGLLAALSAICVIANLFIVDRPPGSAAVVSGAPAGTAAGQGTLSVLHLLSSPRLWALMIPAAACVTGAIVLTSQMIPIVRAWGISPMLAASLLTICSLMGIVGTLVFGWVADRLGGPATMALLVLDGAILWFLLLLKPPYPVAVVLIGLWGLHGAGILPVLAMSLSEVFGRDNFSRAYGLGQLLNLPFSVLCVPVAALIYSHTGSYSGAIIVQAIFFLIGVPLALCARPRRGAAVAVA
jgi:predicted MFS family arabinose efflux permease